MTPKGGVVVLGSANLDVFAAVTAIPEPGETVLATGREQRAGGKGLNQAVAAARSGATTVMLGAVGDDAGGALLLAEADRAGVDVSLLRHVDGPSGTAWIMVRPDGENAIVVDGGANTTVQALEPHERDAIAGSRLLVAQLETPLAAVQEAGRVARDAGMTFVLNAAPAQALAPEVLATVDVLVVNEHEARQLSGAVDPEQGAGRLLASVGAVVVTLGPEGALVVDSVGSRRVPGVLATVVDTTGAGDTFTGVLAATLAAGADLDAAVSRAVVAGALAVETAGAVPSIPTAAQIDRRTHA